MKALEVIRTEGMKGFIKRWKTGIEQVSPIQQTNSQILFTDITALGIFIGIIISILKWKSMWWIAIVLVGALGNTLISLLALKQKQRLLNQIEGGIQNEQERTIF